MGYIIVGGRTKIAFRYARIFFTPGLAFYKKGYLQPRAGHVSIGQRDFRSRLRMGINLSDPPWMTSHDDDPVEALERAVNYLCERFCLDERQVKDFMYRVSVES